KVLKMSNNKKNFILEGDKKYLDQVKNLIFIVSDIYEIRDFKLFFRLDVKLQRQQIRMLLEKSLNCVVCGVCTVICPTGALYLQDQTIKVDSKKCVGCLSCCKRVGEKLKMGCIARNYKIDRLCINF